MAPGDVLDFSNLADAVFAWMVAANDVATDDMTHELWRPPPVANIGRTARILEAFRTELSTGPTRERAGSAGASRKT